MTKLGLLKISGPDASKLLQGQLTCDINSLAEQQYGLGALCNPQGRVVSLFYVIHLNQAYYLVMPTDLLELTLQALKKYAVFYKTALTYATDELTTVLGQIGEPRLFDITAGIPQIYPETSAQFLPHDINLDQLGAISFEKGCYTGQEIIARMHYRAKLKKRMASGTFTFSEPPIPGSEQQMGVIVDVAHQQENNYLVLYIAPYNEAV